MQYILHTCIHTRYIYICIKCLPVNLACSRHSDLPCDRQLLTPQSGQKTQSTKLYIYIYICEIQHFVVDTGLQMSRL